MINIRRGTIDDLPQVHDLIKELAVYEKAPDEVTNTVQDMHWDGFGENPIFKFFVAETEEGIVGIALYYIGYSTWKGKMLFLEDLIVTERLRRGGIGKMLFNAVAHEAKEIGAKRMRWQVLDWNEPAIAFYKKIGADISSEWLNCTFDENQIKAYSAN